MDAAHDSLQIELATIRSRLHLLADEAGVPAAATGIAQEAAGILERLERRLAEVERVQEKLDHAYRDAQYRQLQWRGLTNFAPEGHVITDSVGVIVEVNRAASVMFATAREFLKDKPLSMFISRDDWPDFYRFLADTFRDKLDVPRILAFRLRSRNGQPIKVNATVQPVPGRTFAANLYEWTLTDRTELYDAEEALLAERSLSESLLETAPVCILLLDRAGAILRINAHTRRLLGVEAGALFGRSWWSLLVPEAREAARSAFAGATSEAAQRVAAGIELHDVPSRSILWLVKRLTTPIDRAGAIAVGHDISELEHAQQRALRAEKLAAIGQMVTTLAHESRNALQRTQACLERLRWRAEGRPEELDLIDRVQQAQNDLTRLFEDLRYFAAPLRLSFETCDVADIWREAWEQAVCVRRQRQAELREEAVDGHCVGNVDRFRLVQVFRNLFDNSLECPVESLRVTIRTGGDEQFLHVWVRDNGPGFGVDVARRIFDPFFTTKPKGSGLGMAIAKRVIDAHSGQIEVQSTEGAGTVVRVTLPRSSS